MTGPTLAYGRRAILSALAARKSASGQTLAPIVGHSVTSAAKHLRNLARKGLAEQLVGASGSAATFVVTDAGREWLEANG